MAKGEKLEALLAGPQVAEGIYTAKSVYERLTRAGLEAPILQGVYRVLYEGQSPREAVDDLLGRPQREESTC